MELTKKEKTIKYVVYCAIIAFASLLQNVDGLWIEIANARCFLVLPITMLFCYDEDEKVSVLMGLFAGVLWDIVSVQHKGYNAIFIMAICYIASVLVTHFLRPTFWVGTVFSTVATLLYVLIYWVIFVALKGGDGTIKCFFNFYLPSFFYTAIVGFLLHLCIIPLKRKLNKGSIVG